MINKYYTTILLLAFSLTTFSQETLNVYKKDFSVVNFLIDNINSIVFNENETIFGVYNSEDFSGIPISEIDSICTDDGKAISPVVQTVEVSGVSFTSARVKIKVESVGNSSILERGICWNNEGNAHIRQNKKILESHNNPDEIVMDALALNTTYYVRAYARNSAGKIVYADEIAFTTMSEIPVVETVTGTFNYDRKRIECIGRVEKEGASAVTERGLCWSTDPNPTINDIKRAVDAPLTSRYSINITDYDLDEDYFVRAYAINSYGVGYGNIIRVVSTRGNVTYSLAGHINPINMPVEYPLIVEAMDSACYYYSKYTEYVANIRIDQHPGVPTAEASYRGQIKFGASTGYMWVGTAMHEVAHYFGMGTTQSYKNLIVNGVYTGKAATDAIRDLTHGTENNIFSDGVHFWPYGINYKTEITNLENADKQQEALIIHAKLVWAMQQDCGWQIR